MSIAKTEIEQSGYNQPNDANSDPYGGQPQILLRNRSARIWLALFQFATMIAIVALSALLFNIVNDSFGLMAIKYTVPPEQVVASLNKQGAVQSLDQLSSADLITVLQANVSKGVLRRLEGEQPLAERTQADLYQLVVERVVAPELVASWSLWDSLVKRTAIQAEVNKEHPGAMLQPVRWLNLDFLRNPQSSVPLQAGVRTAILGSLWVVLITILFAVPIGIGAAIYLEEYAGRGRINSIIQTNIDNLAGVPSIIYGMLGLTIFVRALEPLTSGTALGASDPTTANGRTIVSAGMTLGLLVLPIVIINAQEAIRAVPRSLRDAGYGLGATKWQVTWTHVLGNALPGILTGTILAISRALGETAPLIVVGASTFITQDPNGPFSKFTVLPMQIYQWTSRPQAEFRHIAAAASLVLLGLLLLLNGSAIYLRNRYGKKLA